MTDSNSSAITLSPLPVDRAIRVAFVIVSLIFSDFATRLSLSIGIFETIISDMLGGKLLPHLTVFVLKTKALWVIISSACAVTPFLFAFRVRSTSVAIYGIAGATAVQVIQAFILWTALTNPLIVVIRGMSGMQ